MSAYRDRMNAGDYEPAKTQTPSSAKSKAAASTRAARSTTTSKTAARKNKS